MKIAQPDAKRQAEIKSKFLGDPKKQQEELGKLINEFGSPLAGCFPKLYKCLFYSHYSQHLATIC